MISQFRRSEAQVDWAFRFWFLEVQTPGLAGLGFHLETLGRSASKLSCCWQQRFFVTAGLQFLFPCMLSAGVCPQFLEAVHYSVAPPIFKAEMLLQVLPLLCISVIFLLPSFALSNGRKLAALKG